MLSVENIALVLPALNPNSKTFVPSNENLPVLNPCSKPFVPFNMDENVHIHKENKLSSPFLPNLNCIDSPFFLAPLFYVCPNEYFRVSSIFNTVFYPGRIEDMDVSPEGEITSQNHVLDPLADSFYPSTQFIEPNSSSNVEGSPNNVSELDKYPSVLDTTPQIVEYNTPDASFSSSFCCLNEIDPIEFSPVKVIVSNTIDVGVYVFVSRSDVLNFIAFSYFIYSISLIIMFAVVLGPVNEGGYPNNSVSSGDLSSLSESTNTSSISSSSDRLNEENAHEILLNLRKKNVNRVIIGTLNINTVKNKLDQLQVIIGNSVDILTIQETKLDKSVTTEQLMLNGYSKPYRLDRNKHGVVYLSM